MKSKSVFVCTQCGAESPKWMGRCPSCGEWNSYVEERREEEKKRGADWWARHSVGTEHVRPLREIAVGDARRIATGEEEWDAVLGGGVVPGSVILLGGHPGIGKSTLCLQIARRWPEGKVLYVTGEESAFQVKMRAERLGFGHVDNIFISTATDVGGILRTAHEMAPGLLIVDSVQTLKTPFLESAPGSVGQIRESTAELLRFAKQRHVPVILIGHITKEGLIAGPKVLEHMVDVVLQLEGDSHYSYRLLRVIKNRYGSTEALGIYRMGEGGMEPVANPSEFFMDMQRPTKSGSATGAMMEGFRPLLVEAQALVTPSIYGTPQRSATGFDMRRLAMLLAVVEKRLGLVIGRQDVFLHMVGGIRVQDPGMDMAVLAALLSSLEEWPIPAGYCFAGEVGLTGELRLVSHLHRRISEAAKLGFHTIFIPALSADKELSSPIEIVPIANVQELYRHLQKLQG